MADQPAADLVIDEELVRALLRTKSAHTMPDAVILPLSRAAEGWDSAIWRLGDRLAVRLPRRAAAAPLVRHEQEWLPRLAPHIEATGIRVPTPLFAGRPDATYPWAWSIVPWIDGAPALTVTRSRRSDWAPSLARALVALHRPAPEDHPRNPFRGVPLSDRSESIDARLAALRASGSDARLTALAEIWRAGVAAPAWSGPAVWVHGDLHPANLIATEDTLAAIIDFGDLTAGDPAYDLAIAWLAFDAAGRASFISATSDAYDAATWVRARAWAAAMTVILLGDSDDNPAYARLAAESREELTRT